jgi:predicted NodU family carbamoyl transferase
MKLLGINISHNFSICVFENKILKDVWYEERFNLTKDWGPDDQKETKNHIIAIFKKINFKPDLVCYSSFYRNENFINNDFKIINNIQKQLDNPNYFFDKNNHHIYHALSAFYFSKLDEAMSIVIDGGGSQPFNNCYQEIKSIFYINKKLIYTLYRNLSNRRFLNIENGMENYSNYSFITYKDNAECVFSSQSLGGYEFSRACELIGLKGEDAGKLMGLSSYAYAENKYPLDYEKVELAKKTQEKTFNQTCVLIEKAFDYKKIKNIILSGGYFLNCSNNFKYVKKYPEINFFVDPIPTDAGTAIGACIYNDYR